ncbi:MULTISPECIES: IclR family transcriptional regulator [unclassified Variovorax]|uniref:IclR family transcriptional regulator n=1 Tax=unclassified Variovorax TaxID=663243 RepID=UPI000D12C2CC|nr:MULTISPECIES: IclR family transcriptional regulator [unclassified Variovorax]AVQ85039.1 IclR family transcriptional regulator [Variovorax sp. PMC12]QRY34654.1 IclR family transcriptional regulator [Variovorax sp. PDNC026]
MPTIVPAATRTMTLLEVFAREKRELSNSDLARLMDLPESSCSDLLHTLHELGYLLRTARSRRFYPTARLLTVAKEISASDPLYAVGAEACELLRDRTGETGLCGRLESGVVKVIALSEGRHALRYMQHVGDKLALHVSALGKAILAIGTPEEAARQLRLKPLRSLASGTITDLSELEAQVARAREQGWIWVENEGSEGLTAVAVAGQIGGETLALSVAGLTHRMRDQRERCIEALQEVKAVVFREQQPVSSPASSSSSSKSSRRGTKAPPPDEP